MAGSQVRFEWQDSAVNRFQTGVSLHSHTLHSRESMEFIGRITTGVPLLSPAIRAQQQKYRKLKGRPLDLSRAWWTPPLSPRQAFDLERAQMEQRGLNALVSLTDHDNIDAGLQLHVLEEMRGTPISVEWTVPFRRTFFHLGIHNMPGSAAAKMMDAMQAFTTRPEERDLLPTLEWLAASPATLIVWNHPLWDENHIGTGDHDWHARTFAALCLPFLHAFELNGLRPWKENQRVVRFAAEMGRPVISGGDRHAREPNACANLTNAQTFAEFAGEVRADGWSDVLFLPQYQETYRMRILQNMCDILEDDATHSMGWTTWSDRVFYRSDEGPVKSLREMLNGAFPSVIHHFVALMKFVRHPGVRFALRAALSEKEEYAL